MKRELIFLWKTAIVLISGWILGTLLLTLAFCLPIDRMYSGYQSVGLPSLERRDGWHRYLIDYESSTLDNNTECLMMKVSATPLPETGENILQKALRCYTLNNEWNHGLTFQQYEWNGHTLSCDSYERYWHGYAVLLKPLMLLLSYTDIVFLNIVLQLSLIVLILYLFDKRDLKYLQLPFLIFQAVNLQFVVALCLDYSVCFYLYTAALVTLLGWPKIRIQYPFFFMVTGMATAYLDLLTWPLVTLAVPLIVFLSMEKENLTAALKKLAVSTLFWSIGYAGQWAGKWIVATIFLDDNIILDAIRQLGLRSSSEIIETGETVSWLDVIRRNLSVFDKSGYQILFVSISLWLVFILVQKARSASFCMQNIIKEAIPYLVIASYPVFWYLLTKNHSFSHCWMTWRILSISVFAVCCSGNRPVPQHSIAVPAGSPVLPAHLSRPPQAPLS